MVSPYPLNMGAFDGSSLPVDDDEPFLLPVCTTKARYRKVLRALTYYQTALPQAEVEHIVDWLQALAYVENPSDAPCNPVEFPDESGCIAWAMDNPSLIYAPMDPFSQTGFAPQPYNSPPWRVATGATALIPALQEGDVYTDYLALASTLGSNIFNVLNNLDVGVPRVRFYVQGEGEVEITFIGFPFGGFAYVVSDGAFLDGDYIDLRTTNLESFDSYQELLFGALGIQFTGGAIQEIYHEFTVSGAGTHYVDIYMLPQLSAPENAIDIANIVGFGGGIRSIELCGFDAEGVIMPTPQFRIENCQWETRPNDQAEWSPVVGGENACGEDGQDGANGADGQDGTSPTITTVPINGGYTLNIDNDGDGQIDETLSIFDGIDGANGADGNDGAPAPTPIVTIAEVSSPDGHLVSFDMDGNGIAENAVRINDGDCGDCGADKVPMPVAPVGGFPDVDWCRMASYLSEQFSDVMLTSLDQLAISGEFTTWYEELYAKISVFKTFNFLGSLTYYNMIVEYSQTEVDNVKLDIPVIAARLKQEIYCTQEINYLVMVSAINQVQNVGANSITTAIQASQAITTDQWNEWSNYALSIAAPVDCTAINCTPPTSYFDFTVDDYDFTQTPSTPRTPAWTLGAGWSISPVGNQDDFLDISLGSVDLNGITQVTLTTSVDSSLARVWMDGVEIAPVAIVDFLADGNGAFSYTFTIAATDANSSIRLRVGNWNATWNGELMSVDFQ